MARHPDHYALVIGIDDYPKFRSLAGAKQDAKDFATWLKDDAVGGGLPKDNIWLVLSKKRPVRPIHEDIDDALEELLEAAGDEGGERIYLYFSGHGLSRTNTATDLCLAKWSLLRKGLALDSEDYLSMITGSGKFREVVMFLDCCRIRKVRSRALPPTIDPAKPGDGASAARSFVGYATEFLNAAHEAVLEAEGGAAEGALVRGHFTRALIDGLKGGAAEDTGGVRASRLKEYLEIHTPEIAKLAKHTQTPEVRNGFPSSPEPLFGSATPPVAPKRVAVEIRFNDGDDTEFVLEDGNLEVVKRGKASSGPWAVRLSRGNYIVRDAADEQSEGIRITGHETETVHVDV